MKTQLNEIKRMQQLAGILKENNDNIPEDIKDYLQGMLSRWSDGNEGEYPAGKKMRFSYEEIEHGDDDLYGEEEVAEFFKARNFLKDNGPITINNRIDYTYSTDGTDIHMDWIEPDWNALNN